MAQHLHSLDIAPPDYPVLVVQVQQIFDTVHNDPALAHMAPTLAIDQILQ